MENKKEFQNQDLAQSQKLTEENLDEISGGQVTHAVYYINKGSRINEIKRDVYYCPRNGKYYAKKVNATVADQEFGGNGEVRDCGSFSNCEIPSLDDAPDLTSWFNSKIR